MPAGFDLPIVQATEIGKFGTGSIYRVPVVMRKDLATATMVSMLSFVPTSVWKGIQLCKINHSGCRFETGKHVKEFVRSITKKSRQGRQNSIPQKQLIW